MGSGNLAQLLQAALPLAAVVPVFRADDAHAAPAGNEPSSSVADATIAALCEPPAQDSSSSPPFKRQIARTWIRILSKSFSSSPQHVLERARAVTCLRALVGDDATWEAYAKARSSHLYEACPGMVDWLARGASVEAVQTLGAIVADLVQGDLPSLKSGIVGSQSVLALLEEAFLQKYRDVIGLACQQSEPGRLKMEVDSFAQRLTDRLALLGFAMKQGVSFPIRALPNGQQEGSELEFAVREEVLNGERLHVLASVHQILNVHTDDYAATGVRSALKLMQSLTSPTPLGLRLNCYVYTSSLYTLSKAVQASAPEALAEAASFAGDAFEQLLRFLGDTPRSWLLPSFDAASWQDQRPYLNNTQISPALVAWQVYLSSLFHELPLLLPTAPSLQAFAESFVDVLLSIVSRLTTTRPSRARLWQLKMDSMYVIQLASAIQLVLPAKLAEATEDLVHTLLGFLAVMSCPLRNLISFLEDISSSSHPDYTYLKQVCNSMLGTQKHGLLPLSELMKLILGGVEQFKLLEQNIQWTDIMVHALLSQEALVAAAQQRAELRDSDYPPLSVEEAELVPMLTRALQHYSPS